MIPTPEEFKEFAVAQNKLCQTLEKREWFLGVGLGMDEQQNFRISILVDEDYPDALDIKQEFERKAMGKYKIVVRLQQKEKLHSTLDRHINKKAAQEKIKNDD